MKRLSPIEELHEAIHFLEIQQKIDADLLKVQVKDTFESLQPLNLVKKTLNDLTTLPILKGNILNTSISLLVGYLSKKIMFRSSHNPLNQVVGNMLQMGVTNIVSNKLGNFKSLFSFFKRKKKEVLDESLDLK